MRLKLLYVFTINLCLYTVVVAGALYNADKKDL